MPFKIGNRPETLAELRAEFQEHYQQFRTKRDRALVRPKIASEDRAMIARLDGLQPARGPLVAANGIAREQLTGCLLAEFRDLHRARPDLRFAHVTIFNHAWTTSDEATVIDLAHIKTDASTALSGMGTNWSAVIELQVFTNLTHALGGKILSPHVHATLWGSDPSSAAEAVATRLNSSWCGTVPGSSPVRVELITPTPIDLARVVRYPLKAPSRCKTVYEHPRTGRINVHGSEKGDRYIRYLRMFQILSHIRQSDLMFAGGEGIAIQEHALRLTRSWRRKEARGSVTVKQRDVRALWHRLMHRPGRCRFQRPIIVTA